jgi:acyl transferase domain-containing protein/acyl carrier protein
VSPRRTADFVVPLKEDRVAPPQTSSVIQNGLVSIVAERLGFDPGDVDVRVPFTHYGIASIEGIGLINRLGEWLGQRLRPTLFWDYPTIESLAVHLAGAVGTEPSALSKPEPSFTAGAIAIVGMACRMPGAASVSEFWELLCGGADPIREIPSDRWDVDYYYSPDPAAPGKMVSRWGGFLDQIDYFDAPFFRISPREAHQLDPRQRLMLELAWEALEDGAIPPLGLAGSRTGVFAATLSANYGTLIFNRHLPIVDAYSGMGNGNSVVANRLSYSFDLRGPSVSVDTACSGALVALHLACQSLRAGECTLALVGSANAILAPQDSIFFTKTGGLSPTGRCRAFDRHADGIVRSEGAAVVVLKPLARAIADRDRIHAVIRGSAVNQDGMSNGLMAPNGEAQAALLREAYQRAGVSPADVGYVEAHGTGTPLGDPIELNALGQVLGLGRPPDRKCAIGSVKANIGHLEPAAGLAGLVKAALCIQHGLIPGTPHFKEPNPLIPFDRLPLAVQAELGVWPSNGHPRIAGVSAFGFSGTNAHVVLSEPPAADVAGAGESSVDRGVFCLPLSTRDPHALSALARSYAELLEQSHAPSLADVCHGASVGRSHLEHRLAAIARTPAEMAALLRETAEGRVPAGVSRGSTSLGRPKRLLFVFSGQGSAWPQMGLDLLSHDVVRKTLEACDRLVREDAGWSLLDEIGSSAAASRLTDTAIAQPAIFAVQVALAALWRSWGMVPSGVVGQSVGEVAAAHVAGALTLADAMRVVLRRSQLMQRVAGQGRTAAVGLAVRDAQALVERSRGRLSLAGTLSPSSCVIAGAPDAVNETAEDLTARGLYCRVLPGIDIAFHSHQMDPLRAELETSLADVQPQGAVTPIYSSVSADRIDGEELGAHYWSRNLREPFRFAETLGRLLDDGYDGCLEVSPHPVLAPAIAQTQSTQGKSVTTFTSLRREAPGLATMLASAAALFTSGHELEWSALQNGTARHVSLPSYPWQRRRYWYDEIVAGGAGDEKPQQPLWGKHELLGRHLQLASPSGVHVWERHFTIGDPAYLTDHRIAGTVVVPGAAYLEMVTAASADLLQESAVTLENIAFREALYLRDGERRTCQLVLSPEGSGSYTFRVFSRADGAQPGDRADTLHATGRVVRAHQVRTQHEPLDRIKDRLTGEIAATTLYEALKQLGLQYGPTFQGIAALQHGGGEALGRLQLHQSLSLVAGSHHVHPALLDAALQVVSGTAAPDGPPRIRLPIGVRAFTCWQRKEVAWAHAVALPSPDDQTLEADIHLLTAAGEIVAQVRGLQLRALDEARPGADRAVADCFGQIYWRPQPRDPSRGAPAAMPSPADLGEELDPLASAMSRDNEVERYDRAAVEVARLASAYAAGAVRDLGLRAGSRFTPEEFADASGVTPVHRRLLVRLLDILAGDGILQRKGAQLTVDALPPRADTKTLRRELQRSYPNLRPLLAVMERCGDRFAAALRGEADPLDLLFPGGDSSDAEGVYTTLPHSRTADLLAAAAIQRTIAHLPRERPLRVLEIGAGTGGTTAAVLPLLPPDRTEYFFTDVGRFFVASAERKFQSYPFMKFELLDVEQDPATQGFARHQFDMILAAHVLHATGDLSRSLSHIRQLLRPGGMLFLLEVTQPAPWLDVSFGLSEGWWKFHDHDVRPAYPLVSSDVWQSLLEGAGFPDTDAVPVGQGPAAMCLLTARASAETKAPRERSRWLLMTDHAGSVGRAVREELERRGEECLSVAPCGKADLLSVLADTAGAPIRDVVYLWSLDAQPAAAGLGWLRKAQELGPFGVVNLVQAIYEAGLDRKPRLWLVTQGCQPAGSGAVVFPAQATLWGLGRVVANEHPELWGGLIDLDPDSLGDAAEQLVDEISASDGEDQVAFRHGTRYVPRLDSAPAPPTLAAPIRFQADASYLITGGLTGIGLEVAKWMAQRGARHLVLMNRTPLPPRSQWDHLDPGDPVVARIAGIREIEDLGACVHGAAVDVGSEPDLKAFLEGYDRAGYPPFRGVVHSAGLIVDTLMLRLTEPRFEAISRAKIFGPWLLHQHLRAAPLDFFVLFSSATSLVGWVGQGNYSAGNAFLDAFSHYRRSLGLPAMTINWGLWGDVGVIARERTQEQLEHRRAPLSTRSGFRSQLLMDDGVVPLTTRDGLDIFERLLAKAPEQVLVMPMDRARVLRALPTIPEHWRTGYLKWRVERPVVEVAEVPGDSEMLTRILLMAPAERTVCIESCVQAATAHVLRVDAGRVSTDDSLSSLGMDSIMAVELKNRIARLLGVQVSIVELLKGCTLAEVARQIERDIADASVADLLSKVEQLSPEETRTMLAAASDRSGM